MKRFKKIYIEITNICNLNCSFCPKTTRELRFMDEDAFVAILDAVTPYTDHIYFHLMGEPLLHPKLARFLEISHAHGLMVNITTNGTLIHDVRDVLIEAPALRKMNISLSSFEANGLNRDLEGYVNPIIDFIREATEMTEKIFSIRLWNMDSERKKGSNRANADILRLLEKLEPDIDVNEKIRASRCIKLKRHIYLNLAEEFDWPDSELDTTQDSIFCYGLRDQLGILVDGTVVPCCLDSEGNIPLGNIFLDSIEDILRSPRVKSIYDGFSNRCAVEELCKRCGFARRF